MTELQALGVIGQGVSGVVKRVRHLPTGTVLALKSIPCGGSGQEKIVVTELRTLNSSDCPFVVSFHGAFYVDGFVSLILEYMDAGSLRDVLKCIGAIPEDRLAHIARQVCAAHTRASVRRTRGAHRCSWAWTTCTAREK
jgi:serine/threonine protein kinase